MSLFEPSRDEVRSFFIEALRKTRTGAVATPIETLAGRWAMQHPEYHDVLDHAAARELDYTPEQGHSNPFLHLSMHLSISEQISIDQPPGIRAASERLALRLGSEHAAHHEIMECLGEMLWNAQRQGLPPDGAAYLEAVLRRASS